MDDHWFSGVNPIILKAQTSSGVSKYCFEHSDKLGIAQLMCFQMNHFINKEEPFRKQEPYKKMILFNNIFKHIFSKYRHQHIPDIVNYKQF